MAESNHPRQPMTACKLSRLPMTDAHKQSLLTHRKTIVDKLENIEDLVEFLKAKCCLTIDSYQEICARNTPRNRARELLDHLPRCSDLAYQEFVNALEDTQTEPYLYILLRDHNEEEQTTKLPFLFGQAKEFYQKLKQFHSTKLEKIARSKPTKHDMTSYVHLQLHKHHKKALQERKGFREHPMLVNKPTGDPIKWKELFQPMKNEQESPKVVLLVGSPGSGKTATAYNILHCHTHGEQCEYEYCFVFFILLREVARFDPNNRMTVKQLLLSCFSPSVSDKEKVWNFLENHQEKVLFVLDGLDEMSTEFTNPVLDADLPASPIILIDNLIRKNLLPGANILITARMHCLEQLEGDVDRVVELAGLTSKDLKELINKKLPTNLAENLLDFIMNNDAVASICTIPVNAIGLIDYMAWKCKQGETTPELPKTRASLLLLLTANLLHKHGATLKDKANISTKDVIARKVDLLQKLCKLAFTGIVAKDGPQHIFSEEDLAEHGLTVEEVAESGLMTGHITSVADDFGPADKLLLSFLHTTFQEELASVYAVHNECETLISLCETNNGRYDMMVLLSLGLCGDPQCRPLLRAIYPDTDASTYTELVPQLLQVAWQSPRRFLDDGELWAIVALGESIQYELNAGLVRHLATPFNSLNVWHSTLASAYRSSVVQCIHNMPHDNTFSEIFIRSCLSNADVGRLLGAGGYKGLTLGDVDFTTEKLELISRAINEICTLKQLKLVGSGRFASQSVFEMDRFCITNNSSLECVAFQQGMFSGEIPLSVRTSLMHLCHLHSLDLGGNDLSCRDSVSPLYSLRPLTTIRHLGLESCNLCALCTPAVVELMLTKGLLWLAISQNPIGDEGAVILAEGLGHDKCVLSALPMSRCYISSVAMDILCSKIQGSRSLKSLYVGSVYLCSSSDLSMLTMSSLTELTLSYCSLNPESIVILLQPLANNTSQMKWLNISGNYIHSDRIVNELVNVITYNNTLKALVMCNCRLDDGILHKLTVPLSGINKSLKLLNIGRNGAISSEAVVNLICNCHLEHLALADLNLNTEGCGDVASAIVSNTHIMSCYVGYEGRESQLHSCLKIMQSYPNDGPLRHFMVCGDRAALADQVSTLRRKLPDHVSLSFDTSGVALYLLTGMWYADFNPQLINWLLGAGGFIK